MSPPFHSSAAPEFVSDPTPGIQSSVTTTTTTHPFKAKRPWPPDVSQLSPKDQFKLERKYKRRSALKWARPRWMKATKIAQYVGCFGVLIWGVLLMPGSEERLEGFNQWYQRKMDFIMMRRSKPSTREADDPQGPRER
ncbi:MAG: hypothetical protein M1831_001458 [Alyxoria varia]|nr:MAG: hypothetical protein M1831_001458 [Alyxoria varia]